MLIPVHLGDHYIIVLINSERVVLYDSMKRATLSSTKTYINTALNCLADVADFIPDNAIQSDLNLRSFLRTLKLRDKPENYSLDLSIQQPDNSVDCAVMATLRAASIITGTNIVWNQNDIIACSRRYLASLLIAKCDDSNCSNCFQQSAASSPRSKPSVPSANDQTILMSSTVVGRITIEVVYGNIVNEHVDAIVNAANTDLKHGAGVAAAIVEKGGTSIQDECNKHTATNGRLDVSDAVLTGPGTLHCKKIIHAVGPILVNQNKKVKTYYQLQFKKYYN
jgi:hypothetical protein